MVANLLSVYQKVQVNLLNLLQYLLLIYFDPSHHTSHEVLLFKNYWFMCKLSMNPYLELVSPFIMFFFDVDLSNLLCTQINLLLLVTSRYSSPQSSYWLHCLHGLYWFYYALVVFRFYYQQLCYTALYLVCVCFCACLSVCVRWASFQVILMKPGMLADTFNFLTPLSLAIA